MQKIKEIQKRLPNQPFYLSNSEEVNIKWANNFTTNLDALGSRYGVPTELIAKVKANNDVLQSVNNYEALLGNWLGQWRDVKNSLMYLATSPVPITLPATPDKFPVLPPAVVAYVFGPFIQSAAIVLANPDLTEADRHALGLVKAAGKPMPPQQKKREKASQFNFPIMKAEAKNGTVSLTVTRGENFKGKAILLQVDREGKGVFVPFLITTAGRVMDKITLPTEVVTASWTYRGIYVEGNAQLSDWSPNLYVNVTNEAPIPVTDVEPEGKPSMVSTFAKEAGELPLAN